MPTDLGGIPVNRRESCKSCRFHQEIYQTIPSPAIPVNTDEAAPLVRTPTSNFYFRHQPNISIPTQLCCRAVGEIRHLDFQT
jgi:hypothetical protein